jgi:hypothetical protein
MSVGDSSKSLGAKIARAIVYAVFVIALGGLVNVLWAMAARKFGFEATLFQDVVSIIIAPVTLAFAALTCRMYWEGPNTRAKAIEVRERKEAAKQAARDEASGDKELPWRSN